MRACVCDPLGPRWWRVLPAGAGLAMVVVGLLLPVPAEIRAAVAFVGAAVLVAGRMVVPRLRARMAELRVGAGHVRVGGLLSQRIDARDVIAVSTARSEGRVGVSLVRRDLPDDPVVLEVASDKDLEALRSALGIGHFGFGSLRWRTVASPINEVVDIARALCGLGWLAMAAMIASGSIDVCISMGMVVAPLTLVIALSRWVRSVEPRVVLTPREVTLLDRRQPKRASYAEITEVDIANEGIHLRTTTGSMFVPMREALPEERQHAAAQIESAARRARGLGPLPPPLPPLADVLAPRAEATRDWLQRVDATAATLRAPDAYRRADVHEADLWNTLESPDAPALLRAASARVLARLRGDDAAPRITRILDTERDDATRSRIRVALEEDVDEAATAMEKIKLP